MRFTTPIAKRYTVVIRPQGRTVVNGFPETIPGLRAKFRNGVFDSEKAQAELGWTDEERKTVELKLLSHPRFNHPQGFYLDRIDGEPLPELAATAAMGSVRCIAFFRNEAGESEQCPHPPIPGTDYCSEHQIEDLEREADPVPPVPVAAGD